MQAGTSSVTTSPSQQLPRSIDYDRKRRYLSLLPPPQVIELCLTFDIHISTSLKSTLWPTDLDAAIATLQKTSDEKSLSLRDITSLPADPKPKSQDPPKPPNTSTETPGPPGSSTQPQRFVYSTQPAYPHTPYYSQPSWAKYSHPPYASHPHPPFFEGSSDDLPSYEDMIVEALNDDVRDPEGLAPKDLYTWMAAHYPVQANFRPSASQALQKAFKRGRFEKSLSGKYRLNPNWKGGNTTRRTTRRPQTHSSSLPSLTTRYVNKSSSSFSQPNSSYMPRYSAAGSTSHHSGDPGDLGDAYEAAQHILKALNFSGELLKMPEEGTLEIKPSGPGVEPDMTAEGVRAQLQAQLALLAVQLSEIATDETGHRSSAITSTSVVPNPPAPSVQSNTPDSGGTSLEAVAAILSGVLGSGSGSSSTHEAVPTSPPVTFLVPDLQPEDPPQIQDMILVKQEEQVVILTPPSIPEMAANITADSDDEDMDEVVV